MNSEYSIRHQAVSRGGSWKPTIGALKDTRINKGQRDNGSSSIVVFMSKEYEAIVYSNR